MRVWKSTVFCITSDLVILDFLVLRGLLIVIIVLIASLREAESISEHLVA